MSAPTQQQQQSVSAKHKGEYKKIKQQQQPKSVDHQKIASLENQVKQMRATMVKDKNRIKQVKHYVSSADTSEGVAISQLPQAPAYVESVAPEVKLETAASGEVSPFLRCLLVPEEGAVSIPDEIMKLHCLKSETITENLTLTSSDASPTGNASGMFVIYPNHPSQLIGFHYRYDTTLPTDSYALDAAIYTAQQLSENYDYARKISQVLYFKNTTLPSGAFAINGTMNLVRIDGTLSELPPISDESTFYNELMAQNTNVQDKLGNVSVTTGAAILSIPETFATPFSRLADTSPTSSGTGNVPVVSINDVGDSLDYHIRQTSNPTNLVANTNKLCLTGTTNFDSSTGAEISGSLRLGGVTAGITGQVTFQYYDLFSQTPLVTRVYDLYLVQMSGGSTATMSFSGFDLNVNSNGTKFPMCQVSWFVNLNSGSAVAAVTCDIDITARAPMGSRPGVNYPIIIIAYENSANNSVMTISGVSNYELIPNPQLRQNKDTFYGDFNEREMGFVQEVIARRHLYNIRSVWNSDEYERAKAVFKAMARGTTNGVHPSASVAFGLSDIKRLAAKWLPKIAKVALRRVPVLGEVSQLLSDSASGRIRSRAMTVETPGVDYMLKRLPLRRRSNTRLPKVRAPPVLDQRVTITGQAYFFPTLTEDDTGLIVGGRVYAAVKGDLSKLLVDDKSVRSSDGFRIFGFDGEYPFPVRSDITLLPVSYNKYTSTFVVEKQAPLVVGHSAQTAIWCLTNTKLEQPYPFPVTGELIIVGGAPQMQPLPKSIALVKQFFLHEAGLPLVSANEDADWVVKSPKTLLELPNQTCVVGSPKMNMKI